MENNDQQSGRKLKVLGESLPERCEICHQDDCFNPLTGHCSRCASAAIDFVPQNAALTTANEPNRTKIDVNPRLLRELIFLEKGRRRRMLVPAVIALFIALIPTFFGLAVPRANVQILLLTISSVIITISLTTILLAYRNSRESVALKYRNLFERYSRGNAKEMVMMVDRSIYNPQQRNDDAKPLYTIQLYHNNAEFERKNGKPPYSFEVVDHSWELDYNCKKLMPVRVYFEPEPVEERRPSNGVIVESNKGFIISNDEIWHMKYFV